MGKSRAVQHAKKKVQKKATASQAVTASRKMTKSLAKTQRQEQKHTATRVRRNIVEHSNGSRNIVEEEYQETQTKSLQQTVVATITEEHKTSIQLLETSSPQELISKSINGQSIMKNISSHFEELTAPKTSPFPGWESNRDVLYDMVLASTVDDCVYVTHLTWKEILLSGVDIEPDVLGYIGIVKHVLKTALPSLHSTLRDCVKNDDAIFEFRGTNRVTGDTTFALLCEDPVFEVLCNVRDVDASLIASICRHARSEVVDIAKSLSHFITSNVVVGKRDVTETIVGAIMMGEE